jgi:ArsR family transcriptional regulator
MIFDVFLVFSFSFLYAFITSKKIDIRKGDLSMALSSSTPGAVTHSSFAGYEHQFKALADRQRLEILHHVTEAGTICVCDLAERMDLPQSKLSYHLKILLDASLLLREKRGTWNYYMLHDQALNHLLSEELCCLFRGK